MPRHKVLLLGAGKIGGAISKFLAQTDRYELTVADVSAGALRALAGQQSAIETLVLDVSDGAALNAAVAGQNSVLSALSFAHNPRVAEACLKAGASYFDLTEDVETTRKVHAISGQAAEGQIFMPQCGLAPGFIGIVANHLANQLEKIDTVLMRVGALPLYPTNLLKYNLTWSTDGLINEYLNPCEAIHEGSYSEVLPLEGLEHFSIDGVRYEAFNTSGGLGTLCETLAGRARSLNYKTVRYPGHRELIHFLVSELKLGRRRDLLKDILENAIPMTLQDVVLVFCTVTGQKGGRLTQLTDARKVYHGPVHGETWSAIQITTAAGICGVLDLHRAGDLPSKGFVRQEQVPLDKFLENEFGQYYELYNKTTVKVRPVDLVLEEH